MNNEAYLRAKRAIEEKGEFLNTVSGTSMYPMLRQGRDIIVIKAAHFPLKKHDVPLYRKDTTDKLVLHRIIKKPEGKVYVIRGDNTYQKEYIPEEDIVGCLCGFIRDGKYHDCKKDKRYRVYIVFMRLSFPARYAFKIYIPGKLVALKRLAKRMLGK